MNDHLESRVQNAKNLLKEGRKREAIIDLAKILKQEPWQEGAWYLLALALDDPEKKQYALERTLALNPKHSEAKQQLGALFGKTSKPEVSEFDRAVVLLKNGQRVAARELLREYLNQSPHDERGWYLLGIAHSVPALKAEAYARVLHLNPANERARQQLQKLEKKAEIRQPKLAVVPQASQRVRDRIASNTFYRLGKFALVRATTILLTIFVGVFITVMIANKNGQLDQNISNRLETLVRHEVGFTTTDEKQEELAQALVAAFEKAGLNLSFFPRHLRWTMNALTFDWGAVKYGTRVGMFIDQRRLTEAKDIILNCLPNSLILVGVANLIIFVVGIPLALRLARHRSTWQDKLFSFLSPISSIPSWIHGVILILVFAIEMQLFPPSGMLDVMPPANKWGYILIVGRHMILPVSAIVLSLIFQLVYTWRTYFLIYASEDYVELARAKGLRDSAIEKKYILKPSAPFVITSFSLTLVGFWQMVIALETIFNWPGIGQLYLESLPHFWGESMFPGEMTIAVSLVVLFAYLLGIIVLVLDVVYAMIDPRVRIGNLGIKVLRGKAKAKSQGFFWKRKLSRNQSDRRLSQTKPSQVRKPLGWNFSFNLEAQRKRFATAGKLLLEMRRYPSAIVGLVIILFMIGGSVYAVFGMPYAEIGTRWYTESVTGHISVPKLAQPAWMNIFRGKKLLSTIILNTQDPGVDKVIHVNSTELSSITAKFTFDYNYSALPEEMILRLTPVYREKKPFVNLIW
ncbi:MAG: ABC transporter permease subunit, partial [Chloroflexi bacterium]|nr:ABC transporter permease subunit [Chloroflexota bacterium]